MWAGGLCSQVRGLSHSPLVAGEFVCLWAATLTIPSLKRDRNCPSVLKVKCGNHIYWAFSTIPNTE